MSDPSNNSKKVSWLPWLFLFLGVIILWGLSWVLSFWIYPEIEYRGQFGDSFGAVNALFAGLAFAGVIGTIRLQMRELEFQRRELEEQKEQLQAQNQTLQKQNFENSFFQLLGLHNEIVNSMTISGPSLSGPKRNLGTNYYSGRECFDLMLQKLQDIYQPLKERFHAGTQKNEDEGRELMYKWLNGKYEEFFPELQPYVGHYFRHLYNIVEFVDKSTPEVAEKKFYTDLIRAQLSNTELGLLFYYGLSDRGAEFRDLVEKYALFENIPSEVLIREEHKGLYAPKAYTPD